MMKADVLEKERLKILEEIKDGVVVLPPWLLLVGVYDEVEVPAPPGGPSGAEDHYGKKGR